MYDASYLHDKNTHYYCCEKDVSMKYLSSRPIFVFWCFCFVENNSSMQLYSSKWQHTMLSVGHQQAFWTWCISYRAQLQCQSLHIATDDKSLMFGRVKSNHTPFTHNTLGRSEAPPKPAFWRQKPAFYFANLMACGQSFQCNHLPHPSLTPTVFDKKQT